LRILFTAGGTGGHIYPALAVAEEILDLQPDTQVLFISGSREMERKIITDAGYEVESIPVRGMPRKLSGSIVPFIWRLGCAVLRSRRIIRGFRPSVVLGTGGYVSGPPVFAAWSMGIPVFLQEQNSFPGVTTKHMSRFAEVVFLGFQDAVAYFGSKVCTKVTGNPVRKNIRPGDRETAAKRFGLAPDMKTVLVFGGSQGAHAINEAVAGIVEDLAKLPLQVIWQTGTMEFDQWRRFDGAARGKVRVLSYIDAMGDAYTASDLAVSRAGAMTIAEVTACGLPSVLIPLPTAAENHQEHNARSLADAGAAVMIRERDLTPEALKREITDIMTVKDRLSEMAEHARSFGRYDAAHTIAEVIIGYFGEN